MRDPSTKPKRNHKLMLETGLVAFLVFSSSLLVTTWLAYDQVQKAYLSSKEEMFYYDLADIRDEVKGILGLEWVLDYFKEHPEDLERELTPEEELILDSPQFAAAEISLFVKEDFIPEEYDPDTQMLMAREVYDALILWVMKGAETTYTDVYMLQPLNEHEAYLVVGYDAVEQNLDQGFVIDYESSSHTGMKEILSLENYDTEDMVFETYHDPEDGKAYYIGYLPFVRDDDSRFVLCLKYDWTQYHRELNTQVLRILITRLLVLICLNGILMYFLYRHAISPLTKVKNAVLEYRKNKDSREVTEKMDRIRTRNEIGMLADSLSDLTTEIDRYTKENLQLAREKEHIEAELSLAARIQSKMLPSRFPAFPERDEFDIYALMVPAKEVGGDFYDFFLINPDRLVMVVADVSGKGIPAALFMMRSRTILRSIAQAGRSPKDILMDANAAVMESNAEDMFVTVWLGVLEISTGRLVYASAGHEKMALYQNGTWSLLAGQTGVALGVYEADELNGLPEKYSIMEREVMLGPGDAVFEYTDGVTEATNEAEELFGEEQMVDALNRAGDAKPEQLLAAMRDRINEFVGDADQFDDITMLGLYYRGTDS